MPRGRGVFGGLIAVDVPSSRSAESLGWSDASGGPGRRPTPAGGVDALVPGDTGSTEAWRPPFSREGSSTAGIGNTHGHGHDAGRRTARSVLQRHCSAPCPRHDRRSPMSPAHHRYLLPASPIGTLDDYFATGGGRGLERALSLGVEGTLAVLDRSGLRGRGGAGFPTAQKWRSVLEGGRGSRFVVANGAEGEAATFKDRTLIRRDPYRIVEGAAIAAFVVGAGTVYLATKRSYRREVEALTRAAVELTGSGILQDLSVNIVEGPSEYLYGEEKALLEVIEGRDPLPRVLPPYEFGLFATAPSGSWEAESIALSARAESNPTVVNNVETLASAAHIMARG